MVKLLKVTVVAILFLLIVVLSFRQVGNYDIWMHLKAGEYIVVNHRVPTEDIFSYTVPTQPWINHQWLSQVVLYGLYKIGGITGLILFKVALLTAALWLVFLRGFRGNNHLATAGFLLLAVLASNERFLIRPSIFTLFLTTVYLFILHNYKYKKKNWIYLLPFLQLFWANLHGGFIIGIALIFIYLIGELLARKTNLPFLRDEECTLKQGRYYKLLFIGLIAVMVSFINPYTYKIVFLPFLQINSQVLKENIPEWLPSLSSNSYGQTSVIFYYKILLVATAITFLINIKRIRITQLLIYGLFLYLSLSARRHIALFAFASAPIAVINVRTFYKMRKNKGGRRYLKIAGRLAEIALVSVMIIYIYGVITNKFYIKDRSPDRFGLGIAGIMYPIGAMDFIEENDFPGNVFNTFNTGGYFIWKAYSSGRKVFIDGLVYDEEFYRYYQRALREVALLKEAIEKYEINYFLIDHHSQKRAKNLVRFLYENEEWKLVFFDDTAMIFIKDTVENKEIISRNLVNFDSTEEPEIDSLGWRKVFPQGHLNKAVFFSTIGLLDRAEYEYRKAIEMYPNIPEAYNNLGNVCFRQNRPEEALREFRKAIKADRRYADAHNNLGNMYFLRGDDDKAIDEYKITLKLVPGHLTARTNLGLSYARRGLYDGARREWETVLKFDPEYAPAWQNLRKLKEMGYQ